MSERNDESDRKQSRTGPSRREFLIAGLGAVTAPLLAEEGAVTTGARTGNGGSPATGPSGQEKIPARAYAATSAVSPLGPLTIERRALGPHDVLLDVL